MEHIPSVRMGCWTNHDQPLLNKYQYTTSETVYLIAPVAIALLLGVRLVSLNNFLGRVCDWVIYFYQRHKEQTRDSIHLSLSASRRENFVGEDVRRSNRSNVSRVQNWVRSLGGPSQAAATEDTTDHVSPPYDLRDSRRDVGPGAYLEPEERRPLLGDSQQTDSARTTLQLEATPQPGISLNPPANGPPQSSHRPTADARILPTNDAIEFSRNGLDDAPPVGSRQPSTRARSETGSSGQEEPIDVDPSRGCLFNLAWGFFWLAFGAWVIAAAFSAMTSANPSALLASKQCGSWSLKRNVGKQAMDDDDLLQAQKERRAGQYARNCYSERSITNPDQCKSFYNQTIGYDISLKWDCPFADTQFCHGGKLSAVRFSTGLQDASVLGINTARPPKFNRTAVCVPLDLDQGFIKEIPPDDHHHDYRYEYDLGPLHGSEHSSNYTYRTLGDPFKWDVPAYSMSVYQKSPESHYWTPRAELDVLQKQHHRLTLMFISICRVIYTGPSTDYVFHATDDYHSKNDRYYSSDPRARILACVDWTQICSSEGRNCVSTDKDHGENDPEYEFTRAALRKSDTFHAIQFRLGNGLVAQESIGDYESKPLDPYQWIIESEALFQASLARAQFDAFDIAIGDGHENDPGSYELDTPGWARGKLCGMYKSPLPRGYTNISVLETVRAVGLLFILVMLAYERSVEFEADKRPHFVGRWLVFDSTIWAVSHPITWYHSWSR